MKRKDLSMVSFPNTVKDDLLLKYYTFLRQLKPTQSIQSMTCSKILLDLLLNLWYNIFIIDNNTANRYSFNSTKPNKRVLPERQLFPRRDDSIDDISLSVVTNAIKATNYTTILTSLKWG